MKKLMKVNGIVLLLLLFSSSVWAQRLVVFSIDDAKQGYVKYLATPVKDNQFDVTLSVVWTSADMVQVVDNTSVLGFEARKVKMNTPLVRMITPSPANGIFAFNSNLVLKFEVDERFPGGPINFNFPFFFATSKDIVDKPEWRVEFSFARPKNYVAVNTIEAKQLVDKTPPRIAVLSPEGISEGLKPIVESDKVRVTLSVSDFFGVDKVTVGNNPAQKMTDSTYVVDLTLRYGFEQEFKIVAQDINGLKREETFKIESRKATQVADNTSPRRNVNQPDAQSIPLKKELEPSDVDIDIPFIGPSNPNRYALIIGNEDYSSFQRGLNREANVEFAINDAETFKKYAVNVLGVPESNVLMKTNATAIEMNRLIKSMNAIIRVKEGKAEVFVMYAGHGFPDEKTQEPYLIPVDVSGSDLDYAIKLSDLYQKLTEYPSQRVTAFIDACFSGGGREQGLLAARAVKVKPRENLLTGNLVVFAAASGDQTALPYREKNHGMFTYHVLKLMKETGGKATYEEVSEYLRTNVGTASILINQRDQNPQTNISATLNELWKEWTLR
jgi:hypothetical protein